MADADPLRRSSAIPLPDQVALVLQGGGALGSFQAGVYEALAAARIEVDWVAGISIGAVNAAIIAGNPPERRVERLREFWRTVSSGLPSVTPDAFGVSREWLHQWSAFHVAACGVPGFFAPRPLSPYLAAPGSMEALSFYDSGALAETLDALVDWDLANDGPVRLSVGAVEVESGNFHYFDSRDRQERIGARHVMASGALPPGLPPVQIGDKWWWDGGLVSNTPLSHVLDNQVADLLVFQVDLFAAQHERPRTMVDVLAREKEIRFSSRTRQVSDMLIRLRRDREAVRKVLAKLPPELAADPDVAALTELAREHAVSLVQLIYRANAWEHDARDYEFSARTMGEHWQAGRAAVAETMTKSELVAQNILEGGTAAFDLAAR